MTIDQLIASYEAKGWKVDVASLRKVSSVSGAEKYDINVVSPTNHFGTAQIVVKDGEAIAYGVLEDTTDRSFSERLAKFVRSKEAGAIFAISVNETNESDKTAVVTVYSGTTTVTAKKFIVRERNNTFDFKEII